MVHDAANALAPLTVSRARFVTAKPARVSHRGWVGWAPRGRGKRQSLITYYLDMHVG